MFIVEIIFAGWPVLWSDLRTNRNQNGEAFFPGIWKGIWGFFALSILVICSRRICLHSQGFCFGYFYFRDLFIVVDKKITRTKIIRINYSCTLFPRIELTVVSKSWHSLCFCFETLWCGVWYNIRSRWRDTAYQINIFCFRSTCLNLLRWSNSWVMIHA